MSTISASTTSTTAYKVTADTTGALVLQTGATPTTAMTIDTSQNTTLAGTLTTSAKGIAKASLPAGSVLQVVQTVKSDVFSSSSTSWTDVTGLSASITPTSTSNKVLVMVDCVLGGYTQAALARLLRNSTAIYAGDAASNRPLGLFQMYISQYTVSRTGGIYLDSPSTTASTTYKIQLLSTGANAVYVNRTEADRDTSLFDIRTASSITLMEISA